MVFITMKHYYRITTATGQKELSRNELEEMIYFILSTGQVDLDEMPYLVGPDSLSIKSLSQKRLERFLRANIRGSAFRMAKHLFGEENIVSIKK